MKKNMSSIKHCLTILLCGMFLVSCKGNQASAPTPEGTKDSGGDPQAQEFVQKALKLSLLLNETGAHSKYSAKAKDFEAIARKYDESLKNEKISDLVEMVDVKLFDKFGIEKPAVVNDQTKKIRISRSSWISFTDKERFIQVAMEVFKILNVEDRYENAEALVNENYDYLRFANDRTYSNPYYFSDEDNQSIDFKFDVDDLIIDGGILLKGDEANKKGVAFLRDIKTNPEWTQKIFEAFLKNKTVYIVYESENTLALGVVGLRVRMKGGNLVLNSQQLLLVTNDQSKIPDADCRLDSKTLTRIQRLNRCYDESDYSPSELNLYVEKVEPLIGDSEVSRIEALQVLLMSFHDYMLAALSLHFKTMNTPRDMGDLPVSGLRGKRDSLILSTPLAFGLWPSLEAPFEKRENGTPKTIPFWDITENSSPQDMRFYMAAKLLDDEGLEFHDENMHCGKIDEARPAIAGPLVIKKELFKEYESRHLCMWHRINPPDIKFALPRTLALQGWSYNYEKKVWTKGVPVSKDNPETPELYLGESALNPLTLILDFSRVIKDESSAKVRALYVEAVLRTQTELMSSAQRAQLLLNQLNGMSLQEQSEFIVFVLNKWNSQERSNFRLFSDYIHIKGEDMRSLILKAIELNEKLGGQDQNFEQDGGDEGEGRLVNSLARILNNTQTPSDMFEIVSRSLEKLPDSEESLKVFRVVFMKLLTSTDSDLSETKLALKKELARRVVKSKYYKFEDYELTLRGLFIRDTYSNGMQDPLRFSQEPSLQNIEALGLFLEDSSLSPENRLLVENLIKKMKVIVEWRQELKKLSHEEAVSFTLELIKKHPVEMSDEVMYYSCLPEVTTSERDQLMNAVLDSLETGSASMNGSMYEYYDAKLKTKQPIMFVSMLHYYLFKAPELSKELQERLLELWSKHDKGFSLSVLHHLNYEWNKNTLIGDLALDIIQKRLTNDDDKSRKIVAEIIEGFNLGDRRDDYYGHAGLLNAVKNPLPLLKTLSENPHIHEEYRQRFLAFHNKLSNSEQSPGVK